MAITALQSASSGLSALNTSLEVISNNLANVNTPGFKAARTNFQDLLYVERAQPGVENAQGDQRPIGLYVGLGTRVTGTQIDFRSGSPIDTGRELDVTINGNGFFRVRIQDQLGDGFAYTRTGSFAINSQGEIVMANDQGRRLEPNIVIPENATQLTIDASGRVFVKLPAQVQPEQVGQIEIETFINPAGMRPIGENLFVESPASGAPVIGNPGTDQRGTLVQKFLESSNVDPTNELIDLIKTQRAFEMNSNVIRAADETLRTISTNLRR
ncbi:MAG: flagellar basal-body rod protein FlgG [Phycisphaerales bacterium]